eukprot:707531-Amorphochlora_amoeboformis.AAC.1
MKKTENEIEKPKTPTRQKDGTPAQAVEPWTELAALSFSTDLYARCGQSPTLWYLIYQEITVRALEVGMIRKP